MTDTQYALVDDFDLYVKKIADVETGVEYFVKVACAEGEIDCLRRATSLQFPEHLDGILTIPGFVTDNPQSLPAELAEFQDEIMVMEAAQGQELMAMERPRDGSPKAQIFESDWTLFCEAVRYMNEQGIVHGDIQNTSNIYVQQDEHGFTTFELIDWGGSRYGKAENDLADLEKVESSFRRDGVLVPDPELSADHHLLHAFNDAENAPNASSDSLLTAQSYSASPPLLTRR